jgi:hypothetical protein
VSALPTSTRLLRVDAATSSATAIDTAEGTHRIAAASANARWLSKTSMGRISLMKKQNAYKSARILRRVAD